MEEIVAAQPIKHDDIDSKTAVVVEAMTSHLAGRVGSIQVGSCR